METSISRHRDASTYGVTKGRLFWRSFFCQQKKKSNKLIFKLPPKQHMLKTRGFVLGSACSPKTCFFLRIFLLDVPHQPPFSTQRKTCQDIREAVDYGVIKMNIDTDTQHPWRTENITSSRIPPEFLGDIWIFWGGSVLFYLDQKSDMAGCLGRFLPIHGEGPRMVYWIWITRWGPDPVINGVINGS